MTQVKTANITKLNQFELNQKVLTTDYGFLGTIREFGYLNDTAFNREWLDEQSKPWTSDETTGIVAILNVLPRGSAIVPVSRLEVAE